MCVFLLRLSCQRKQQDKKSKGSENRDALVSYATAGRGKRKWLCFIFLLSLLGVFSFLLEGCDSRRGIIELLRRACVSCKGTTKEEEIALSFVFFSLLLLRGVSFPARRQDRERRRALGGATGKFHLVSYAVEVFRRNVF